MRKGAQLGMVMLFSGMASAVQAQGFPEQLPPSSELQAAIDAEDYSTVIGVGNLEYEACLTEYEQIHCLELLAAISDAGVEYMERQGDFGREDTAEREGWILRHTRELRRVIDSGTVSGFDAKIFASAYGNLGRALMQDGRLAEAEEGLRYALQYHIVDLQDVPTAEWYKEQAVPDAALHLARNLALQGDMENARAFLAAADVFTGQMLLYDESEGVTPEMASEAHRKYLAVSSLIPQLSYLEGGAISGPWVGGYDVSPSYLENREDLRDLFERDHARALARAGKYEEAIALVERSPRLLELGDFIDLHDTRAALGVAYMATGDADTAYELLERSTDHLRHVLAISEPRRIDAQVARANARLAAKEPDVSGAVDDLREAVTGATMRIEDTTTVPNLVAAVRRYRPAFEGLIQNLSEDSVSAKYVFEAAQWASIGETSATLAQVAAAASRGDTPVAGLLRERDEIRAQLVLDAQAIAQDISVPGWYIDDLVYKFYLRNISAVELIMVNEDITALDPAYDALVRPRPLDLGTTQSLLDGDEALVFMSSDDSGTTVFAITGSAVAMHRSAMTRGEIAGAVEELRKTLDEDLRYDAVDGEDYFDQDLARELYTALLAPLEGTLAGKTRMMTVTPGPLSRLPLALLVTSAPDAARREYLIDRFEISTLPAVSSLFSLRCLLRDKARQPAGCGDTQGRTVAAREKGVDLFAAGSPSLKGAPADGRGVASYSSMFGQELADPAKVMQLAYLPGTKREIEAVSGVFGNTRARTLTGNLATEAAVKSDSSLASARFVLFSTHGLVSSETGMTGEPALVFTPPQPGAQTALDDGLLTASEVSQLKLVAEFVVLSACNTASSDGGDDADGLSGLAQAFFYAGAQSLLATHWPLSDASGAEIVSAMFSGLADEPDQRRSTAFREALLKVRANEQWASPAFWAPFVLVGTTD